MEELTTPIQTSESDTVTNVPATRQQRALLFLIAGIVLLVDQVSKYLVEGSLAIYEAWAPIPAIEPFFRLMHATNTGTAFGLFPDGSLFFALMAVLVSGVIIYYNHTLPAGNNWLRVALGLTLGGAVGNLIDRIRLGHVTDFLDFGPWPVFNVADMAIVGGAILLGWLVLQESRQERQAIQAETEQPQEAFPTLTHPLNEPE